MKIRVLIVTAFILFGTLGGGLCEDAAYYYGMLDASIPNLYQEIMSARSFSEIGNTGPVEKYYAGDKIRLQPILTDLHVPQGWVKYYAAYFEGDKLYIAKKSSGNQIVFEAYKGESEIPYYDTGYFYGGTWTPNAYYLGLGDSFEVSNRTFIFGITPNTVKSIEEFTGSFYGEWIRFKKPSATDLYPPPPTPDTDTDTDTDQETIDKAVLCFLIGGSFVEDKCIGSIPTNCQYYNEYAGTVCLYSGGTWANKICTGGDAAKRNLYGSFFCAVSGGTWMNGQCVESGCTGGESCCKIVQVFSFLNDESSGNTDAWTMSEIQNLLNNNCQ